MPQDRESGAKARKWGLETARKIAEKIDGDAKILSQTSNEIYLQGNRGVIKCAKENTNKVGVTDKMIERINFVIGAFECQDGQFELWKLPIKCFKQEMKVTTKGKPNMVSRSYFERHAKCMGKKSLQD